MNNDDFCDICGIELGAFTRYYATHPFVDGRNYEIICWTCACIPKTEYLNEDGKWIILRHLDSEYLNTAEEMIKEEGWVRATAERSAKAVRKLLKSAKVTFAPCGESHIFAQLIFGDSVYMTLDL